MLKKHDLNAHSIQPRVCGDYAYLVTRDTAQVDTTPRVRGLHIAMVICNEICRYNPACAGTTVLGLKSLDSSTIQPRVCGDYMAS